MSGKRKSRWKVACFCLLLLFSAISIPTHAAKGETVRVGIYDEANGEITDANNQNKEYDQEYLRKIAEYTGWEYEYVTGTWGELLSKLEQGEIDLLGSVQKTPEREKVMNFSNIPTATTTYCMLVEEDNRTFYYEDYAAFEDMSIGVMKGSTLVSELEEYSEIHNFSYQLKEYETEEDAKAGLAEGSVDAICLTDMRNLEGYRIIAQIDTVSFYCAIKQERADLEKQLNSALDEIHKENKYYEASLYDKYFNAPKRIALTQKEKATLRGCDKIPVAVLDNIPLMTSLHRNEDRYEGVVIDFMERVSERCGIEFEYHPVKDLEQGKKFLKENPNAVMAPYLVNNLKKSEPCIQTLDTIIKGNISVVCRENESTEFGSEFKLAVYDYNCLDENKLKEFFPRADVLLCQSNEELIKAVRDHKADMALINEMVGAYLLKSPYYKELHMLDVSMVYEDIAFAMSADADPALVSGLNKWFSLFNTRAIRQMVVNNSLTTQYKLTVDEWIYKYKMQILLLICLLISVCATVYISWKIMKKRRTERHQMILEQERRKRDNEYRQQLEHIANFDELTEVYNQYGFIKKAETLMQENPDLIYAVFRINIVSFKTVNEIYGFHRGNEVLVQLAKQLQDEIGEKGAVARLYADNFAVYFPVEPARIKRDIGLNTRVLDCDGIKIPIHLKVGIIVNYEKEQNVRVLMDYAQIAMQKGKDIHGDGYFFYDDKYLHTMLRNVKITNYMEEALRLEQFQVYFQPQYDVTDNSLVGAEALVRWNHPEEGLISPAEFIPIFENNGFIYKLDSYTIDKVCSTIAKWRSRGRFVPVSVNLSRVDLENPGLFSMLLTCLNKYNLPKELLHLEVTESAYAEDDNKVHKTIENLKSSGFIIEMDDFGHGYSSFNMLKDVVVDILKLDMGFLSRETNMDKGGHVIESLVNLAHSIGILVIAEGVETEREVNFLRSIQCNLVQGYFFGKPVPEEVFYETLNKANVTDKMRWMKGIRENVVESNYWLREKLNLLLRHYECSLLDYDPQKDDMTLDLVETGRKVKRMELGALQRNQYVHPDYLDLLFQKFREDAPEVQEFDYRARYGDADEYKTYHATEQTYRKGKGKSRVIMILEEKNSENEAAK